jgi:uncharacterized coiled-coil protein SlyX
MLRRLIKALTEGNNHFSKELDARIAAADTRIAAKEKILNDLKESVAAKEAEVARLRDKINRQEQTLKRNEN